MRNDDLTRLRHMMDAAMEAQSFATGKSRSDLGADRKLALAIVKDIEMIGEAASKVSQETRASHSAIPWSDIINMRNRLIHAYFDIDLDVVWDTVTKDLPPFIALLEKTLAPYKT